MRSGEALRRDVLRMTQNAVYLVEKGVPEKQLHFHSKGSREPVSAGRCEVMGPENKQNAKLVACLRPDRRVVIEVAGRTPVLVRGNLDDLYDIRAIYQRRLHLLWWTATSSGSPYWFLSVLWPFHTY